MTVQVDSTWIGMYIMVAYIVFLIFRSTQPKWVNFLAQHTLILMETTRLKYNLVFINLTWLLGVQMAIIILRGSHSLKILNIVLVRWNPLNLENKRTHKNLVVKLFSSLILSVLDVLTLGVENLCWYTRTFKARMSICHRQRIWWIELQEGLPCLCSIRSFASHQN